MDESSLAADEGEYLDPGYDPQTPDGDNQLLDFVRAETALWTSWGAAMTPRSSTTTPARCGSMRGAQCLRQPCDLGASGRQ